MVPGFRLTILMKIIKISYLGQKVDKISNGLSKIKAISGGIRVDTDRGGKRARKDTNTLSSKYGSYLMLIK